jgi:hypothetical protein
MEGGLVILNKDALDRYENGETLTPKEGFGVGAPRFTTLSKTYSWLNDGQTVAKMVSGSSSGWRATFLSCAEFKRVPPAARGATRGPGCALGDPCLVSIGRRIDKVQHGVIRMSPKHDRRSSPAV